MNCVLVVYMYIYIIYRLFQDPHYHDDYTNCNDVYLVLYLVYDGFLMKEYINVSFVYVSVCIISLCVCVCVHVLCVHVHVYTCSYSRRVHSPHSNLLQSPTPTYSSTLTPTYSTPLTHVSCCVYLYHLSVCVCVFIYYDCTCTYTFVHLQVNSDYWTAPMYATPTSRFQTAWAGPKFSSNPHCSSQVHTHTHTHLIPCPFINWYNLE